MINNFDWSIFEKGYLVVSCVTIEDAKEFIGECEKRNLLWYDGNKCTVATLRYDIFNENTAYVIAPTRFRDVEYNGIALTSTKFEESNSRKVVVWTRDKSHDDNIAFLKYISSAMNDISIKVDGYDIRKLDTSDKETNAYIGGIVASCKHIMDTIDVPKYSFSKWG